MNLRAASSCLLLLAVSQLGLGQQATGLPPFGSFSGGPADTVNNANLNVHFAIPVVSKAGRGMPFSYTLTYDTGVWYPVTSGSTQVWTPAANWGWSVVTQVPLGYITYHAYSSSCVGPPPANQHVTWTIWTSFAYVDWAGTAHSFGGLGVSNWPSGSPCGGGPPEQAAGITSDDSGYSLTAQAGGSGPQTTLLDRSGNNINAPQLSSGSGSVTDSNGNVISASVGSSTTFTDTFNTTALTVSGSNPQAFAYTNPGGGTSSYTVNYTSQNVRTNFGCSGITEYNAAANLVSSIRLPDGTSYQFSYEATPGYSNSVTGRLQTITLPTGASITYTYYSSPNGISCATGSPLAMSRTTPDGTWGYSHGEISSTYTGTTITDPDNNQTTMYFQGIYETQRNIYSGSSSSGTLLETVDTCYNSTATSPPCTTTSVSAPITEIGAATTLPGTTPLKAQTVTYYNSYGLPTEVDTYDYGSNKVGTLIGKTLTSYNTSLGNIVDRPSTVTLENGSSTILSQTSYGYDSHGNATSVSTPTGSTTLSQGYSYYSTGNVNVATDVNGAQTSYTYNNCNNSLLSNVSLPLGLTTAAGTNCAGGVFTWANDTNGETTTTTFGDANYWRPTASTDPTGAVTNIVYAATANAWASESHLNFGTSSTDDTRVQLDGLGRTHLTQRSHDQSYSSYDSVEIDYDEAGRPKLVTLPFTAAAGQTTSSAPGTKTQYDAMGRPTQVQEQDGSGTTTTITSYGYSQNDVLITVAAPAGENPKVRQLEYDARGRLTSVCEITTAAGAGTCGQTRQQTGYWTKYQYDAADNLYSVTQNAQSS